MLLQDRPARGLPEIVALRMVRLETLQAAKYGLHKEMAVDLNALVRVHASAMLPRAVGALDDSDMRVIGQRLAEHLDRLVHPVDHGLLFP